MVKKIYRLEDEVTYLMSSILSNEFQDLHKIEEAIHVIELYSLSQNLVEAKQFFPLIFLPLETTMVMGFIF